MDIGVSTACLYPLETEKALYELAERGVKNVEIFVNSIDELEGQVLVELRRIIGEYGMNVISCILFLRLWKRCSFSAIIHAEPNI